MRQHVPDLKKLLKSSFRLGRWTYKFDKKVALLKRTDEQRGEQQLDQNPCADINGSFATKELTTTKTVSFICPQAPAKRSSPLKL